ncbi:MAG: hypothetical protein IT514_14545 [Burkholderiales bacterium]|nr:hypothetical protein [Burkholderiales bacterium]
MNGGAADSSAESHRAALLQRAQTCLAAVHDFLAKPPVVHSASDLAAAEQECAQRCDALFAALMGALAQGALDSAAVSAQAHTLARSAPKRLKAAQGRQVNVQFQRGKHVPLRATYYRRRQSDAQHREKGLFPAFVVLGIHEHASPAACAQMARSACAVASLEEAAAWLRDTGGLEVDIKTLRRVTRCFGQRARCALPGNLQALQLSGQGRSVVISVDGGRLRVRRDKAGARTPKGRRRYHTDWREPLLLHVYLLGPDGRMDRTFTPVIDGTLGGADALFEMLRLYLPLFNALQPTRVLLIADGAPWIWTRFMTLIEQGAIACPHPVIQLIDFYHAVEHLGTFAQACTFWPRARRIRWRNHARQLLRAGKIETVLEEMQALLMRRPRSKALKKDQHYFQRNRRRFSYAWARRLRLSIGSGPMESAIRRVINLRLKGPGIFWHEDTAEAMIMIRAYYKARRWNELAKLACAAPPVGLQ